MHDEAGEFQAQLVADAQDLSAVEFVNKHGKSNLHIFDRVRKDTDRCIGAYGHLVHLLLQARKFVQEAHTKDYLDVQVDNWRKLYVSEIDRVLHLGPSKLNAAIEDDDHDAGIVFERSES